MVLEKGIQAPQFVANAVINDTEEEISLEQFNGKKIAMYFYPKDMTPGCTTQAQNLRDHNVLLADHDIVVIGVSSDSVDSHKKFIAKYDLPYYLISDSSKEICSAYDVYKEKSFMGKIFLGIHRTTYLIDEEGKIFDVIVKPNVKQHAKEVLEKFGIEE